MFNLIQKYCNHCKHELVNYDEKFCSNCLTKINKDQHDRIDNQYNNVIKSKRWRKLSESVRKRKPRCEMCVLQRQAGLHNLVNPSQEVHHIKKVRDRPDLEFDRANLMALCKKCHKQLTDEGL